MQDKSIVAKLVKRMLFQNGQVRIKKELATLTSEVLHDIRNIPHEMEVTTNYFVIKLLVRDDAGA